MKILYLPVLTGLFLISADAADRPREETSKPLNSSGEGTSEEDWGDLEDPEAARQFKEKLKEKLKDPNKMEDSQESQIQYLLREVEKGNTSAMAMLGDIYSVGSGNIRADIDKAIQYYERVAKTPAVDDEMRTIQARSTFRLAVIYDTSEMHKKPKRAKSLFTKAIKIYEENPFKDEKMESSFKMAAGAKSQLFRSVIKAYKGQNEFLLELKKQKTTTLSSSNGLGTAKKETKIVNAPLSRSSGF